MIHILKRRIARFVGTLIAGSLAAASCVHAQPMRAYDPATEVVVLMKAGTSDEGMTAEDLVNLVESPKPLSGDAELLELFGNPLGAEFLIAQRIPDERRTRLLSSAPEERLQRYVTLTYGNRVEAANAASIVARNGTVLSSGPNAALQFSASTSDPRFSYSGNRWDYQWGHSSSYLQLTSAWDKTHGTAYVAVLDTGIQQDHGDLDKNFRKLISFHHAYTDSGVEEGRGYEWYGYRGHGTHVAGIVGANTRLASPPAGFRNPAGALGAGVCLDCPLMIVNVASYSSGMSTPTNTGIAKGLTFAISAGAQVINMSFGGPVGDCATASGSYLAVCDGLAFGAARDVVMVAAGGNDNISGINWPARDSRVLPVGGMDDFGSRWDDAPATIFGSNWGPPLAARGLIAPSVDVLSTVYTGYDWNFYRCGDQVVSSYYGTALSFPNDSGFGVCMGTSMAAPFVSGIAALVRSANPMVSASSAKAHITSTASDSSFPSEERGFGHPRANAAVTAIQAAKANRLTPLFGFHRGFDATTTPTFFTVVPQQGVAAMADTLRPRDASKALRPYHPHGKTIHEYGAFPDWTAEVPKASVWVFTTYVNPKSAANALQPLRRYIRCSGMTVCTSAHSQHSGHAYATALADETSLMSANFRYIGIEGYVYPLSQPQPVNTVRLMRAYSATMQSYTLYPEASPPGGDFGTGVALGYVYNNVGPRPTI